MRRVCNVDSADLPDVNIKYIFIDNHPEMKIAFDILLEADFEVSEETGIITDLMKRHNGPKFRVLVTSPVTLKTFILQQLTNTIAKVNW